MLLKLPASISVGFWGEKGTAVHPEALYDLVTKEKLHKTQLSVCTEEIPGVTVKSVTSELPEVLLTIQNDLSVAHDWVQAALDLQTAPLVGSFHYISKTFAKQQKACPLFPASLTHVICKQKTQK